MKFNCKLRHYRRLILYLL